MAHRATVIAATRSPEARPFVAADVGGTHARIALMRAGEAGQAAAMLDFRQYACADFPDLSDIVVHFLRECGADGADRAVIAIAGILRGDELVNTNLPWPVSLSRMRGALSLRDLRLVNDFEAMAYATPYIDPAESVLLAGPQSPREAGATLVIGPGTGLGAALWTPSDGTAPPQVLATEAGHAALAPGNVRELALLGRFLQRWPHVDNERALSGPGLLNLYRGLCELDGARAALDSPAAVAQAAQQGGDAQALEALHIFCAMLGSLVGDLVLTFGARAVYLAGGMPAHIKPFLLHSRFAERYLNKGVLRSVLEQVSVSVIDHGRYGLLGAAAWYLDRAGSR
ncbi:glucokinase [Luteimonas aquatica]|uniref:glucokinase n=1 Tax=Luteimonas aquatica TaxID=450364 RepID=UPI001F56B903|nr:glucokinase [Luteimonas aquatica]